MSHIIECSNVSKSFGSKQALNNVSFTLGNATANNHGATALVGPNGAGKTTLFSLLCHYQLPSSGEIKIFDQAPGSNRLFGRVSALPQDAQFDDRFAISHQLSFYAKLQGYNSKQAKIESQRVLDIVDLSDVYNERPAALSHGMRKRVAIAQTLIGQPQLVMLDEPTAGLDPANARKVRQLVTNLSDQAHFVISSHNLSELEQLCTTVLMLDHGVLTQQEIGAMSTNPLQQITLHLMPQTAIDPLTTLRSFSDVIAVRQTQQHSFIVSYHEEKSPRFDLTLLENLYQHGLNYRQIAKGVSLEEQLFSEENT